MIVEITSCAPTVALRNPAIPAISGAGQRADQHRERHVQVRVHALERGADPHGEDPPGEVLALAADVEQAAAECERDGETHEDERRRLDQRLLEVEGRDRVEVPRDLEEPVQPRPLEDRLVRLERVLARRDEDDEAAHDERDQHREERRDEPARPLREGETLAEALLRVG